MKLYTIGFTKKSAEEFFTRIKRSGARKLVDVRLNNSSQLAGFTKKGDLEFFTREICDIEYEHVPILAPTQDILSAFKTNKGDWGVYEHAFLELMAERRIEDELAPEDLDGGCLLCSEETPHHCHRRLVAEYLREKWKDVEIEHLP